MLMAYLHMLLSALIYDGTFAAQAWNSERDNRIERKNAEKAAQMDGLYVH